MEWAQAHSFVRHWFGSTDDQVVLSGRGTSLINVNAVTLLSRLGTGRNEEVASLSTALENVVLVYPWLKPHGDTVKRRMTHDVHLSHNWRHPGYWVDLPARVTEVSVQTLVDHLDTVGLRPTMLTGILREDGETIRGGRLWWRFDTMDDSLTTTFLADQRRWQWFIQTVAVEFTDIEYVSIREPGITNMVQNPLPGTVYQDDEVILVAYRDVDDHVDYRSIEWYRDSNAYADEFMQTHAEWVHWSADIELLGNGVRDRIRNTFTTWDDVLTLHGWRVCGTSTNTDSELVTWWTAPGARGATALTLSSQMVLYDGTWLSGLKEASDYGVELTKLKVACLLWWDGDTEAMNKHFLSGKRLLSN